MKTTTTLVMAAALAAACSLGHAGTLSGATSTLNGTSAVTSPPKITAAGQVIQIKHSFGVLYYGPDKNPSFACNAKLEYSDGTAPEMVAVKYPAEGVARMRQYTKPGKYTVSLTGIAHNGTVGCLGSATSTFTIEDGMPAPVKKGADTAAAVMAPAVLQGLQGMVPVNLKAKVKQVVLRGGSVYPPGAVSLYSTITIDKPDNNCLLDFSVMTVNEGAGALNVELMKKTLNGGFNNANSSEYNPGPLNFPNQGKFRVVVKARTDVESHCSGSATADFDIKGQKIGGDAAPGPTPTYGSFISKITAVEKADAWDITVHGAGDASCKYHVRTWILPQMSIFGEQAMVYEKNIWGTGKGFMTVAKQGASNVLVETIETPEDRVGNKGCLGTPLLELKPTPKPVLPPQPKKGTVLGLSIPKNVFAPGEPIPGTLKVQGDNCAFVFRVRKMPFINLSDDVVFAVHTKSLEWNLNNLGQTLPPGNWNVMSQPGNEPLAPGDIRCEIGAGGGVGQVFFTVSP